jgi:hypothetical protein
METLKSLRKDGYFVSLSHDPKNINLLVVECSIYIKDYDEETGGMDILMVDQEHQGDCQACLGCQGGYGKKVACPLCGKAMSSWALVKRTYRGTFTFTGSNVVLVNSSKGMPAAMTATICDALSSASI